MKRLAFILAASLSLSAFAQEEVISDYDNLQNWRPNDKRGLNVFEDPKTDNEFDGFKVRVGGDFALQFQGLNQTNGYMRKANPDSVDQSLFLNELGNNFNLPTANFNIDAQFAEGVRMHLRTYLSARHHNEAWVKGGYLQIDDLGFIKDGFADGLMEMLTIRVGLDEINYGDAHFRRTDNGRAIFNPFVGNYIMDAFTTEAFGEVLFRKSGILAMAAISNGKLNQSVVNNGDPIPPVFYFKAGYDDNITEDFRLRVMGSGYISSLSYDNGTYLYSGDRGGSRYYNIANPFVIGRSGDFNGRFNPGFKSYNSFQGSVFAEFKGVELFGFYETVMGDATDGDDEKDGVYNQYAAELVYRFGGTEQFYLASRWNAVSGTAFATYTDDAGQTIESPTRQIQRLNVGGGWYMTKNIMTKVEYVRQAYLGEDWAALRQDAFQGLEFNGFVIEAAISF